MDEEAYFKEVCFRLVSDEFLLSDDHLCGIDVTVAIKKPIKLSIWTAKMSFFVFMCSVNKISKDFIELFSKSSLDSALKRKKELLGGAQSMPIVFSLFASKKIDEDTKKWIQKRPKRHISAVEMPVLYDLNNCELFYYSRTPMYGAIFYNYFRGFITTNFK